MVVLPEQSGMNLDIKINIFKTLDVNTIVFVSSLLTQQEKAKFARVNRFLYRIFLGKLYGKITVIYSPDGKSVKEYDPTKEFQYPTDKSIVSGKIALRQLFETIHKTKYATNSPVSFRLLINEFNCFYSLRPTEFRFPQHDNSIIRLKDLEHTYFDCLNNSLSVDDSSVRIPRLLWMNIFILLTEMKFCSSISIPTFMIAKFIYNNSFRNHFEAKNVDYGIRGGPISYIRQCIEGIEFLRLDNILYDFSCNLKNLEELRISFAEPTIAKYIIKSCRPEKLRSLTLDHFDCAANCHCEQATSLTQEQVNKKLILIEEFFESPHIKQVFQYLHKLKIVFHNGYNRMVFKNFLKTLNDYLINEESSSPSEHGFGCLECFEISEAITNSKEIYQVDNRLPYALACYRQYDLRPTSTAMLYVDLLGDFESMSFLDFISWDHMKTFKISTRYVRRQLDITKYEEDCVSCFRELVENKMTNSLKNEHSVDFSIKPYDTIVL